MSDKIKYSKLEKTIGDYIIQNELGCGGFAKVYQGIHIPTGEKVAIKIMDKSQLMEDPLNFQRVENEISILKKVHHKNIIKLYELMESPQKIYLVMEFCEGGELFDYIVNHKKLSEKQACKFFQEIINSLEYLHSQSIVHRDIKPENMLLYNINEKNKIEIKLIDFGISRNYPRNKLLNSPCGTTAYAPPEMHKREEYYGLLTDIWSAGVVLYSMIYGYLPFSDDDSEENIQNIINGNYELDSCASENVRNLIKNCLNVDPLKRYDLNQIRSHQWFNLVKPVEKCPGIIIGYNKIPYDENIINLCCEYGYDKDLVLKSVLNCKFDRNYSIYYLVLKKKVREGYKSCSDLFSEKFIEYINNKNNLEDKFLKKNISPCICINNDGENNNINNEQTTWTENKNVKDDIGRFFTSNDSSNNVILKKNKKKSGYENTEIHKSLQNEISNCSEDLEIIGIISNKKFLNSEEKKFKKNKRISSSNYRNKNKKQTLFNKSTAIKNKGHTIIHNRNASALEVENKKSDRDIIKKDKLREISFSPKEAKLNKKERLNKIPWKFVNLEKNEKSNLYDKYYKKETKKLLNKSFFKKNENKQKFINKNEKQSLTIRQNKNDLNSIEKRRNHKNTIKNNNKNHHKNSKSPKSSTFSNFNKYTISFQSKLKYINNSSPEKLKISFFKKNNHNLLKSFESSSSTSYINFKVNKPKQYKGPIDIRCIFFDELSKIKENIENSLNKNKINHSKITQYKYHCSKNGDIFFIEILSISESIYFVSVISKQGNVKNNVIFVNMLFPINN